MDCEKRDATYPDYCAIYPMFMSRSKFDQIVQAMSTFCPQIEYLHQREKFSRIDRVYALSHIPQGRMLSVTAEIICESGMFVLQTGITE